ncbi:hypothetical protein ACFOLF_18750 [Paenibacillus sepulcri]|uniref:Uncharacterized protein n=1 Tax=Paenibacillus sepulcri TaxID=359917 RepID=A0ABS7CAL8_9BACL|nr:hypothetical protein [Paenibacillus sepulcri]
MKETFIVKHAVGGPIFIDTKKEAVPYTVEPFGEGWKFTVSVPLNEKIRELLQFSHELNMFLFHEFEDAPTVKTWYYIKEGPVEYDAASEQLTIVADSRIEYVPDTFMKQ